MTKEGKTDTIWRDIPSQRGQYQISTDGEIRNRRGKALTTTDHNGYRRVFLSGYNRKSYYVQNLMSETFLGGVKVTHKNGDKADNRLENLIPR